jgi:hypothetical protein
MNTHDTDRTRRWVLYGAVVFVTAWVVYTIAAWLTASAAYAITGV